MKKCKLTVNDISIAPDGWIYMCMKCGKMSKDIYGKQSIDPNWDASCFSNAQILEIKELPPKMQAKANGK